MKLDFKVVGMSGVLYAWNRSKADPRRGDALVEAGGSRLMPNVEYSLKQLNYDPATGGATIFLESSHVSQTI